MNLKNIITAFISTSMIVSSLTFSVSAEVLNDNNGRFKIFNAPNNAQYNIYKDVNQNYIYDDEDILLGTLNCNNEGVGFYNNLSEGYYVAVLQGEYPKLDTDLEYSFFSDGESISSQEAYTSNKLSWNITYASTNDSVNIMYDVPLYKQTDSRWRYSTINGSGSTMGNMGCLITSFAMLRSYETGKQILPSQMMKSYSSSTGIGVVYSGGASMSVPKSSANYGWKVYGHTSAYGGNGEIKNNTKTNQTLLKVLYDKVKNGPVIYGGYSTYGARGNSNHWIVIKGYIGDGQNFSASDFYVCDPGANRTTLADYISKYPYWDRIIYNPNSQSNPNVVTTTTKITTTSVTTTTPMVTTTLISNLTTLPKHTTQNTTTSNITTTTKSSEVTTTPIVTTTLISNIITLPTRQTVSSEQISEVTDNTTITTPNNDNLIGDINQDNVVNQLDLFELKRYLLNGEMSSNCSVLNADIDNDNKINLHDYNMLLNILLNNR